MLSIQWTQPFALCFVKAAHLPPFRIEACTPPQHVQFMLPPCNCQNSLYETAPNSPFRPLYILPSTPLRLNKVPKPSSSNNMSCAACFVVRNASEVHWYRRSYRALLWHTFLIISSFLSCAGITPCCSPSLFLLEQLFPLWKIQYVFKEYSKYQLFAGWVAVLARLWFHPRQQELVQHPAWTIYAIAWRLCPLHVSAGTLLPQIRAEKLRGPSLPA